MGFCFFLFFLTLADYFSILNCLHSCKIGLVVRIQQDNVYKATSTQQVSHFDISFLRKTYWSSLQFFSFLLLFNLFKNFSLLFYSLHCPLSLFLFFSVYIFFSLNCNLKSINFAHLITFWSDILHLVCDYVLLSHLLPFFFFGTSYFSWFGGFKGNPRQSLRDVLFRHLSSWLEGIERQASPLLELEGVAWKGSCWEWWWEV